MAKKTSLSFRVPKEVRDAIVHYTEKADPPKSQSAFMTEAVLDFIEQLDSNAAVGDLLLPEWYKIPTKDSKMVSMRIKPEVIALVQKRAPRLYHTATRLILLATMRHAFKLLEKSAEPK